MEGREDRLEGSTYKLDIDHIPHPIFLTINNLEGKPYELFVNSIEPSILDWSPVFTRLVSALLRQGSSTEFLVEELKSIYGHSSFYYKGKQYTSIIAVIGDVLLRHTESIHENNK